MIISSGYKENITVLVFMRDIEGGVATFVRTLLSYSKNNHFSFKLILEVDLDNAENRVDADGFTNCEVLYFNFRKSENRYIVYRRLAQLIDDPKAVIISNESLELAAINQGKLKNPVINIIHGNSNYYYSIVKEYGSIVNCFIGVSEYVTENARRILEQTGGPAMVRKIFVPVRPINNLAAKQSNLKYDLLKLIYVGRIEPAKGSDLLCGICRLLDLRNIKYTLTVVGIGSYFENLRSQSAGLIGTVIFKGQLPNDEVLVELSQNEIFVFPSYSESVGLAVVEAMKCGLIPVTSDLESGLPELVINNETGFRVKPGDEKAFSDAIALLGANEELKQRLRANAIRHANELFDANLQTEKFETAIVEAYRVSGKDRKFHRKRSVSVLDSPYFPNLLTSSLRKLAGRIRNLSSMFTL